MSVVLSGLLAMATSGTAPMLDQVISVASRSAQPAGEIAGSVSLIDRDQLDRHLVKDIADLVRYEPGVTAPEEASRFGLQGFSIRGLSGNRIGIEIDGVPIADGFSIGSFSNAGRAAIETDFVDRAELLRGPASTLYGSDALGGVVSLKTLGVEHWLPEGAGWGGQVRASADSANDSSALSAALGWREGPWRALFAQLARRGDQRENHPRPGGLSSNPADRQVLASLFKLGLSTVSSDYTLSFDRHREAVDTDVRSLVYGPAQYATTRSLLAEDLSHRERWSLRGEWQWSATGFDRLSATVYQQRSRVDQDTSQTRDAAPPRSPPTLRERNFLLKNDLLGLRLQGEGRFELGGAQHWQVFGLDYARSALSELRDGRETNLLTGVVSNVIIGERFPLRDFPDSHSDEWGLFWQDEIGLGDRLALIPGLRYERYRIRPQADAIFREDNPGLQPVSIDASKLSPKLGARFDLNQQTQLFAQYALGFRAPPMFDVNIGFTIPAFNYRAIPNPDLKPEYSEGLELGLRLSDSWGYAELVVFENRYRDLIDSRVNLGRDANGTLIFQSINRSRARIRGVEARAEFSLPVDTLSLNASFAYAHGDDTAQDRPLNSVDPTKLVLGLVWEPLLQHRFELVSTAVAGKRRIDASAGAQFAAPGYLLLDGYWHWQLSDRVGLDLAARNLAGRRYWLWSGVRGLAPEAAEVDLYTQPGRSYSIALSYRF